MDIEKAPLINITEKHDKCNGTGIIESDIDRHCYCDEGMITRFANREEQRNADHEYYVKVVEQVVKAERERLIVNLQLIINPHIAISRRHEFEVDRQLFIESLKEK